MVELSTITGGVSLGKNLFEFLGQIRTIVGADVVSAYFRYDGTRVAGSDKIEVELQKPEDTQNVAVWFYYVISNRGQIKVSANIRDDCKKYPTSLLTVQAKSLITGQGNSPNFAFEADAERRRTVSCAICAPRGSTRR